jgi:hypothetical protein
MSKITATEATADSFRVETGSKPTPTQPTSSVDIPIPAGEQTGPVINRLDFAKESIFNVEIMESNKFTPPSGMPFEVAKIKITADARSGNIESLVRAKVQQNVTFTDHFVTIQTPQHASDLVAANVNQSASSYDVITKFNYSSQRMDEIAPAVEETSLPSMFSKVNRQQFEGDDLPLDFSSESRERNKNIVIPQNSINRSTNLEAWPIYNQVRINNKYDNTFSNFLRMIKSQEGFLEAYLGLKNNFIDFNVQTGPTTVEQMSIPVFDVLRWTKERLDADAAKVFTPTLTRAPEVERTYPFAQPEVGLGPNRLGPTVGPPQPPELSTTPEIFQRPEASEMVTELRKSLFIGFVNNLSQKFRRFEEIFNRQKCPKEDYLFSVEKFIGQDLAEKVQNFYAPAADDSTIVTDTQVFEGKTYTYTCKGHYVIIGNKYYYRNLRVNNTEQFATLEVVNEPTVVIIPIDLFRESIVAIQPPPLAPQIKFSTKMNSSNRISVHLTPTKGMLFDNFTTIRDTDSNQLLLMDLNAKRRPPSFLGPAPLPLYRFMTVDDSGHYEIFRMTEPPKALEDFAGARRSEIRKPYFAVDAVFKDRVTPNRKYYYLFRKISTKGFVSNPTAIYEVELLVDADDSKIIVNNYEIPSPPRFRNSETFQSLFQITPAVEHVIFNENQTSLIGKSSLAGTVENLSLGIADKSLWGRKLKFRIRSTTSGKIIDYNVTFKLTKNKTEEDF